MSRIAGESGFPVRDPETGVILGHTRAEKVLVQYVLTDGWAKGPTQAYYGDAGWDLYADRGKIIWPFSHARIGTGVCGAIPYGNFGAILGRSSTWHKLGLVVIPAVIDSGFRGELEIAIFNPSIFPVRVRRWQRLAQIITMPIRDVEWAMGATLPRSDRAAAGFGSSGQ